MKNKIIILITFSFLIIGIILFLVFNKKVVSTITLDINPSIKVNLDKNNKVINVKAVNNDAKKIVSKEYKNKTIEEFFDLLVVKVIENDYVDSSYNNLGIIIYADGKINVNDLPPILEDSFKDEGVNIDLVVVEEITKEDIKLAKKENVNPAKISYIQSVIKDNKEIDIDDLSNRPVSELRDVKETGFYCEGDYKLEGSFCIKEISTKAASNGMVCPEHYEDIKGSCYKSVPILEKEGEYYCDRGGKLEGDKCVYTSETNAEPVKYACQSGKLMLLSDVLNFPSESGENKYVCINDDSIIYPTSACIEKIDGKCYQGPSKPTIDGKCLNTDIMRNGRCYEAKPYEWVCPDGKIKNNQNEPCGIKNYKDAYVSEYKCPDDNTLEGDKCVRYEYIKAFLYRYCNDGYTMYDNSKCIDYKDKVEKSSGYYCEGENTKLVGDKCIFYESVPAKKVISKGKK